MWIRVVGFLISWQLITHCRPVCAQGVTSPLLPGSKTIAPPLAIAGEPFGVLQVEVPLPANWSSLGSFPAGSPRVLVENDEGRLFYPAVSVRTVEIIEEQPRPGIGRPGGLIDRLRSAVRGESVKRNVPVSIQILALWRGAGPIRLQLLGDVQQTLSITPSENGSSAGLPSAPVAVSPWQTLLARWWEAYTAAARRDLASNDFPGLVHKYLTVMLGSRLGLPAVDLDPPPEGEQTPWQPLETLALMAAIEPLREQILEEVLVAPSAGTHEQLLPPSEPQWAATVLPPLPAPPEVETLAKRVPPECFYLRFGSFANYVWFQEIAERFGGDITQAVLLRGFNYDAAARMERMLASKLTTIAKMFGDKLVGDMALIGSDLYMQEGASLGALFFATNPELFLAAQNSDRQAVLKQHEDASLSTLTIAGKEVSLLSTPDNRIRSFLVSDGPYVLVTSSHTLVRRFLEVGSGVPSLADSHGFQWARTWMPEANQYAVFGYFSPEFFHRLVSPQYQIELRRRLQAIAHIELAEVATRVAAAEGLQSTNLEQLQQAGLLAPWFDERPDGARTLQTENGWIDSLRGARGSFLPIADVDIQSVSTAEAQRYAEVASFYQQQWQRMDPLLFGLRRFRADGQRNEQVAVEAYIAPFEAEKYGWVAKLLGAPTPIELQLPADDAVSIQAHLRGAHTLGIVSEDYHLFAGIKDMIPPAPEDTQGLLKALRALKAIPGYLGAWPRPAIIEQLPLGLGLAAPDYAGFSRMIGGLWRWTNGDFSLLSFDRSILDRAIPQLGVSQTPDLAQVRARVANLSGSQLSSWINAQWYRRGWQASQGNARLLDTFHQQLRVPSPNCLAEAEQVLDVRLQCPLGGKYEFQGLPGAAGGWWRSTAWSLANFDARGTAMPPADYSAPWIDWFRGGKFHLTQNDKSLALVGSLELELQPLALQASPTLPSMLPPMNFDLFNLPMKLFGERPVEAPPSKSTRSF